VNGDIIPTGILVIISKVIFLILFKARFHLFTKLTTDTLECTLQYNGDWT
jgi:hypothetical protein